MIRMRRAAERGHANHGWLDTYHTFSFGSYHDPAHVRFRALRVMNEDWIAPGAGFGTHPHDNMEIVTYVLEGALEHRDSMGHGAVLRAGELQRMSAGTGITHSEFNASKSEPVHLYQIWLFPERRGIEPGYEQRRFDRAGRRNRLRVVAAPGGEDGALVIHQDARIFLASLEPGRGIDEAIAAGRHVWVQVLSGVVSLGGHRLTAGDGAALSEESRLTIVAYEESEVMVFDLA